MEPGSLLLKAPFKGCVYKIGADGKQHYVSLSITV